MPLVVKLRQLAARLFYRLSGVAVVAALFIYLMTSWLGLYLAGEQDLLVLDTFFYWILVTASTVGYGDYSPASAAGRLFAALWVIPLGLSLFAVVVTRFGMLIHTLVFKGKKGLLMLTLSNHTVIIGWNGARTLRLIELLLARQNKQQQRIVLCTTADIENPLPGKIDFVRVSSFTQPEDMARTSINLAQRIIIDTDSDDVTLTTALFCADVNPDAHKTAYLQQESLADLLKVHCPKVEVIPSVSIEMLARSTLDPGSSQVHKQLLDSTDGMTQYSLQYDGENTHFQPLFEQFKSQLDATLIGVRPAAAQDIVLNPPLSTPIQQGDSLFYIAAHRIELPAVA
ncbi:potassium channel protein [Bacterioplanes sanyensis]|uniref:Potassium channel protein n=1 Tax=Bacterioplanes sanyensis TaxID=1249553 RepID=A0A222FFB4_9GAMM|nr:ion channel [Bacterioplanes sanyensis]ASP37775.1 potassium channel protein [Bacterioplanes sanyensis]